MKTTFRKLFSLISLSVALAGGFCLSSAEAQVVKISKPGERHALVRRGDEIEISQHYKPSTTPWADDKLETHKVSGSAGQASGGVDLQTLETRAGTFVNKGEGALSVGAAGQAHLIRVTTGGQASTQTLQVQGRDVLGTEASGSAEGYLGARGVAETGLEFGKDPTIKAMVGGFAGQNVSAQGSTRVKVLGGGLGANGSVSAGVGVEGSAGLSITKEGTKIALGGFAGDSASATGGFDVMGVGAGATATGYAGVGAEISSTASFEKGKLKIKGTLGAALGVGGKVDVDLTVDLAKVEEEGKAFASNVEHFGKQVGQDFQQAGQQIDRDFKQAGAVIERDLNKFGNETKAVFEQEIPNAFKQAGQEIEGAAKIAGSEVKNFFENDVKNSFNQAGREIDHGVNKAGNEVKNFFENDVKNAFNQAGNDINREANKAAQQIDQGFKSFGNDVSKGFKSLFGG